jgi:hypothetical protein
MTVQCTEDGINLLKSADPRWFLRLSDYCPLHDLKTPVRVYFWLIIMLFTFSSNYGIYLTVWITVLHNKPWGFDWYMYCNGFHRTRIFYCTTGHFNSVHIQPCFCYTLHSLHPFYAHFIHLIYSLQILLWNLCWGISHFCYLCQTPHPVATIILIMYVEEYKLRSYPLCRRLQFPINSSLFFPSTLC